MGPKTAKAHDEPCVACCCSYRKLRPDCLVLLQAAVDDGNIVGNHVYMQAL